MRLTIDHRTVYRFSAPQGRLVQMLRLTPENTHDQTVASWRIDVDRDARLRDGRDGFGNATTMLYVEGPVEAVAISVHGAVVMSHSSGVVRGTHEPLPPPVFLRTTSATLPDPAIAAFATSLAKDTPLATLHALNGALHERFTLDTGRGDPQIAAAAAFAQETATARDVAQILAVAARSLAIPARYVSGYRLAEGEHQPTPHGWAEAHVEGLGWVAFDPSTGQCPEEDHVRVAVALDAAGAAPVAGSRLGEGVEMLDVDVVVSLEG